MSSAAEGFRVAFRVATGGFDPHPWQQALALRDEPAAAIDAPTGAGKTEAVVMDWLWRRRLSGDVQLRSSTSRRLVLAFPMRVLVEQTRQRVERILTRLSETGHLDRSEVSVTTLLGGARDDGWTLEPAADQVIVATIDMALSRALNRGFGRNRAAWPIDFGLINTDTLWVLDEVQLLDAAVATSAQLSAFRRDPSLGYGAQPDHTTWMSATLHPDWVATVDHPALADGALHGISTDDEQGDIGRRLGARKTLGRVEVDPLDSGAVAEIVLAAHAAAREHPPDDGSPWLTIALCNTVGRAVALYERLERLSLDAELLLLHSRFRLPDRSRLVKRLDAHPAYGGRILVTTQVIEAGVDLDAAAMVTELAPWPSLVQRAGRLNRTGRRPQSALTWLDPPDPELAQKLAAPYSPDDLQAAREALRELEGGSFSPADLRARATAQPLRHAALLGRPRPGLVLRRRDLLALFDTDPTLDGDDADVRAFIREGDQLDVSVAWREMDNGRLRDREPAARREELCSVSIAEGRAVVDRAPWRWSYSSGRWEPIRQSERLVPGDVLLVDAARGGYGSDLGWAPRSKETVDPVVREAVGETLSDAAERDHDAADPASESRWLTIAQHTDHVVYALERDIAELQLSAVEREALAMAARFHDAGKAHPSFQERVTAGDASRRDGTLWAKSATGKSPLSRATADDGASRAVFRHEVASVLLLLAAHGEAADPVLDLAVYLVGAHHGKLRLTPRLVGSGTGGEAWRACLGVVEGDAIPEPGEEGRSSTIDLGGAELCPPLAAARLELFDLGSLEHRVWSDRALDLLEGYGPFRLAYLEALLRAADQRASREEREDG